MSVPPPPRPPGGPERRRSTLPDAGPRLEDSGRYPVPPSAVRPRFADDAPVRPARRAGCSGPALSLSLVVLVLGVLGLLLPPIGLADSFTDRFRSDEAEPTRVPQGGEFLALGSLRFMVVDARVPAVPSDRLTITVDAASLSDLYAIHVASVLPAEYLAGSGLPAGWNCGSGMPSGQALAGRIYSLNQTGTPPARVELEITALPEGQDDPAALSLVAWNDTTGAWEFLAASADESGTIRVSLDYLPRCFTLMRQIEQERRVGVTLGLADTFSPAIVTAGVRLFAGSLRPSATGALNVVLAPGFQTGQGYAIIPLIQNYEDPALIDAATVQSILSSAGLRSEHARQIAAFVVGDAGYAGAAVDYRALPDDLRDEYTTFIRELADLLHGQDRTLTVMLPSPVYQGDWLTGAYDWRAIGRAADEVVLTAPLDPLAYVPAAGDELAPISLLLDWATSQVSASRLTLGLDALSVEDHGGLLVPVTLAGAFEPYTVIEVTDSQGAALDGVTAGEVVAVRFAAPPGSEAEIGLQPGTPFRYVQYRDAGGDALRTIWLTDASALLARSQPAVDYRLGGIAVSHTMSPGVLPGLNSALLGYLLNQPATSEPAELMLIVRENGVELLRQETHLGESWTVQPTIAGGTLAVEVQMAGQTIAARTLPVEAARESGG